MISNAKQGGSSSSLRKPDLWYYDQLPPTARKALANANFNWSAGYYLNKWKKGVQGFKSGNDIAANVKNADKSVKNIYNKDAAL